MAAILVRATKQVNARIGNCNLPAIIDLRRAVDIHNLRSWPYHACVRLRNGDTYWTRETVAELRTKLRGEKSEGNIDGDS